jgi:hypothetical protein
VPGAPWQIPLAALEFPEVLEAVRDVKDRHRPGSSQFRDECTLELIGFKPFEGDHERKDSERIRA